MKVNPLENPQEDPLVWTSQPLSCLSISTLASVQDSEKGKRQSPPPAVHYPSPPPPYQSLRETNPITIGKLYCSQFMQHMHVVDLHCHYSTIHYFKLGQDVESGPVNETVEETLQFSIYWVGMVNLMLMAFGFFFVCYSINKMEHNQRQIENALVDYLRVLQYQRRD